MKKEKWLILIAVLLLVSVFAGLSACGGNEKTSSTVAVTDENGEVLTDANGNPITAVLQGEIVELTNANGEKIYDENGEVRTTVIYGEQQIAVPVTDENGNLVYDEAGNLVTTMVSYTTTTVGSGGITGIPITDSNGNIVSSPNGNPLTYTATYTVTPALPGQNTANWSSTFGGTGGDAFVDTAATPDGGFAALVQANSKDGSMADLAGDSATPIPVLIKYSRRGRLEWRQIVSSDSGVQATGLAVDEDGNIAVCGLTRATNLGFAAAGDYDAVVFKFNDDGELQWTRNFGGSRADGFEQIAAAPDGGFVAVGYSSSSDGTGASLGLSAARSAPIVVKFGADGSIAWQRAVGATGDTLTSVAVDTDGSVYAAGNFTSSGANSLFTSYGRADAGLVKFSSSGEQQWVQQFGGSRVDNFLAVTAASDGGCVAVGRSASRDRTMSKLSNNGGYDAIMVKYNADGSIAWQSVVHGLLDDCFTGVCATEDGFALAGYTNSSNSDFRKVGNRGGTDAFLVRTDASGEVLENTLQSYGGTRDDRFNGICALESGELVACGATLSTDGDLVGSAPASDGKNTVGMIARFEAAKD